jgi:KAP family P-loop domain
MKSHESVVCVRFNPWRFRDETTLLLSYFSTLADALGRSLSTQKEKIGKWLQDYGAVLAPLSLSFFGLGVSPGQATAEAGKLLSSVDLDELRKRIEELLCEEEKRIVILMDDIDRLDKNEIYAVFRLVKLSADFSYTAYVLAFDDSMVSSALQERYATGAESGENFLEKIIQVPLRLPPPDEISLRQFCFEGVDEAIRLAGISLSEEQAQVYVRHFIEGLENRLRSPRMCKRYANALAFALPILAGEVNSVDLMLIEGIRVFYPGLYSFLRKNKELFAGVLQESRFDRGKEREEAARSIDQALAQYPVGDQNRARELLKELFPKLSGLYGNVHYGSDWDRRWTTEQRVASKEYFDRYFSYAIPEGDVPDSEILGLLDLCKNADVDTVARRLGELLNSRNAEKLIRKLRIREDTLPPGDSISLGISLALSGGAFPNPDILFAFTTPLSQAAILIAQLAKNLPAGEDRFIYAKGVLSSASPLTFAVECFRWLRTGEEKEPAERLLPREAEDSLGALVADRIASVARERAIHLACGRDTPTILWAWGHWGKREEAEEHVKEALRQDSATVLEFPRTFVPTAWGMETGLPIEGDFEQDEYKRLCGVVNPETIYNALREVFGDQLVSEVSYAVLHSKPFHEKIAFQFASVHRQSIAEQAEVQGKSQRVHSNHIECRSQQGAAPDA